MAEDIKATIAERGQVTIPKALRDKLGLTPGTVLDFDAQNGYLVARKKTMDAVSAVIGCLKQEHQKTDDYLAQL
ncbi:MAG: AbrB/MazE/SpoVT family DNA-binding domain-containing protein, partial [Sulfuricella sp.]